LDSITFTEDRFPTTSPITSALAADVARVINEQALHVHASVFLNSTGQNFVQIEAGGPLSRENGRTPTEIEVMASSVHADFALGFARSGQTTGILGGPSFYPTSQITAVGGSWSMADVGRYVTLSNTDIPFFNDGRYLIVGFTSVAGVDTLTISNRYGRIESSGNARWYIGLRDDHTNSARPPRHRYGLGFDLDCQIDVLTSDDNTRNEVVDLVLAFFSFFLEAKYFTFMGRSGFQGQTTTGEFYQIVINPPLRITAESEFPRPGDATGKVYLNGFGLNVTCTMYLDRDLLVPGTTTPFVVDPKAVTVVQDSTLPLPPIQ
jgi:hypothetical protein